MNASVTACEERHILLQNPTSNDYIARLHPLGEESILNLSEFHSCGTLFIVVRHVIDPRADGIAPHKLSIIRL